MNYNAKIEGLIRRQFLWSFLDIHTEITLSIYIRNIHMYMYIYVPRYVMIFKYKNVV